MEISLGVKCNFASCKHPAAKGGTGRGTGRGSSRQGLGRKSPRAGVFYLESPSPTTVMAGVSLGPAGPDMVSMMAATLVPHSLGIGGGGFGGLTHTFHRGGATCLTCVNSNHKQMPPSESSHPPQKLGCPSPSSPREAGLGAGKHRGLKVPPACCSPQEPQPLSATLPETRQPRAGNLPILWHRHQGIARLALVLTGSWRRLHRRREESPRDGAVWWPHLPAAGKEPRRPEP